MKINDTSFLIFLIAGMLFCGGCAPGHPPTAKVTGTVNHKGNPLKQGTIIFEVEGHRPATGKIVNGKIVNVTTYEPDDGVSIGLARIAVSSREEVEEAAAETGDPSGGNLGPAYMGTGGKSLIAPHYGNPATSHLTAAIEKGKENVIMLELE
ncbi:MAG: hypothetical protein LBQ54_02120 [Planctomycetaceae bacterium]|jgi:hypothetical protein|nr:hypothetical protein [Planctomycetaceae bacterium]